jgi:type I restriction enzyme, S subunit
MNADCLLTNYERILDVPEAIVQLRRFALDLAVLGKITPYARRVDEVHPLAKLSQFVMGQAPPGTSYNESGAGTVFVKVGEFGSRFPNHSAWTTKPLKFAKEGDILICVVGATIGKLNLAIDCAIGRSVAAIRPMEGVDQVFLYYSLMPVTLRLREDSRGTAQGVISRSDLAAIPIWLPPLAEQRRIVAKIDVLMAMCDQLEAARADREAKRDRFTVASLARLNAPEPTTFRDDAGFAIDALPVLTTRCDQIKQLRKTILNLAACGKLVPQEENDEPAAELLNRVEAKKLGHANKRVTVRPGEAARDSLRMVDGLPKNWEITGLGAVCNLVTSGSRGWAEYYAESGSGFIRAQNIRFGRLRLEELAFVNPPRNSEGSRTQVAKGDLLIVITGAGVTNPALLDRELGEAYVSQHVGLARPADVRLAPWLLLCLMADAGGRAELVERAYGAGKPGLNLDNIRSLRIPIPPLAEQRRIVAKVDELMAICDRLEESLAKSDDTRRRLLDTLLHEALIPADGLALERNERIAVNG